MNTIGTQHNPARGEPTTKVVRVPNLRAQHIIRDVAENVLDFLKTFPLDEKAADAVALATFRGAFVALRTAEDKATATFAANTLEQINATGVAGVQAILAQFTDKEAPLYRTR